MFGLSCCNELSVVRRKRGEKAMKENLKLTAINFLQYSSSSVYYFINQQIGI